MSSYPSTFWLGMIFPFHDFFSQAKMVWSTWMVKNEMCANDTFQKSTNLFMNCALWINFIQFFIFVHRCFFSGGKRRVFDISFLLFNCLFWGSLKKNQISDYVILILWFHVIRSKLKLLHIQKIINFVYVSYRYIIFK